MVSTKIYQQYANQLFQISCCIAHARRNGFGYCIPSKSENEELHPSYKYKNVVYGDVDLPVFKENERTYNHIPPTDNICLQGYWQDYNYFWDEFEYIKYCLTLDYKMLEGRVSIHLRLTDGYENKQHYFPRVGFDYYKNAVNHFKDSGHRDFIVFSDNIPYCKENITSEKFGVNIEYSENRHPIEDLIMQSCCEHNIIANSTFSAWAAYLNQNPNKTVVRPNFFLGEKLKHLHKNIYRQEWITI